MCCTNSSLQSQGNQSITRYCSVMKHTNCFVCRTQRFVVVAVDVVSVLSALHINGTGVPGLLVPLGGGGRALTHWGWVKIDNSQCSNCNREKLEPKVEIQVGRRRLAGVWQDTKY